MSNDTTTTALTGTKTRKKALGDRPATILPERTVRTVFGSNADQFLLNAVKEACYGAFSLPTFEQTLQKIKSHFFDRDYDAVFQNPEHLPVYSARYAPSRALCYYHMFLQHPPLLKPLQGGPSTILCIGAGAGSELMGIAAAMVHVAPLTSTSSTKPKKSANACIQEQQQQQQQQKEEQQQQQQQEEEQQQQQSALVETANTYPAHASKENTEVMDASKQTNTNTEGTTTTIPADLSIDAAKTLAAAAPGPVAPADKPCTTATIPSVSTTHASLDKNSDALVSSMEQQLNLSAPLDAASAPAATTVPEKKPKAKKPKKHQVTVVLQDYVDWTGILDPMQKVIQTRMHLPKDRLKIETEVNNILDLDPSVLARVAQADLITFLFVLNELFQDKKRTMLLLAKVVANMRPGAHMLVADSAGSFSNLQVGERTYMVYMMLDHLKDLEIVYKDDATWYRCPSNVTYPLKLENMRHFVRIYKKL